MPKKKKQKKIDKKIKLLQKIKERNNSKKIYTDTFLKADVELAPAAFEVYEEINASNTIVLRKNSDLEIGDDLIESPEAKSNNKNIQKEYHKKIESVVGVLKTESDDVTIKDILAKIEEEKTAFEQKIQKNTQIINEPITQESVPEKDTLFAKIYAREFADSLKPKSIINSIVSIFTSDIVWQAIAGALILAVAIFYFQGLQPTLLRSYSLKAKIQAQNLTQRYGEQTKDFFTSQNIILGRFSYQPQLLCSQLPLYDQSSSDIENINRLRIGLFSDPNFKKLDNTTNFSSNEIDSQYNSLYSSYSFKLKTYQNSAEDLLGYAKFLEYKNNWIKSCAIIEQNVSNLEPIQDTCSSLLKSDEEFAETREKVSFWSEIEPSITTTLASCQSLSQNNLKDFQKSWFIAFDKISFIKPKSTVLNEELLILNELFINSDSRETLNNIDKIIEKKSSISGQWYILNFNF